MFSVMQWISLLLQYVNIIRGDCIWVIQACVKGGVWHLVIPPPKKILLTMFYASKTTVMNCVVLEDRVNVLYVFVCNIADNFSSPSLFFSYFKQKLTLPSFCPGWKMRTTRCHWNHRTQSLYPRHTFLTGIQRTKILGGRHPCGQEWADYQSWASPTNLLQLFMLLNGRRNSWLWVCVSFLSFWHCIVFFSLLWTPYYLPAGESQEEKVMHQAYAFQHVSAQEFENRHCIFTAQKWCSCHPA